MDLYHRYYDNATCRFTPEENSIIAGIATNRSVKGLYKLINDINLIYRSTFTGMGFGNDRGDRNRVL
jgi:hypothetical protein